MIIIDNLKSYNFKQKKRSLSSTQDVLVFQQGNHE